MNLHNEIMNLQCRVPKDANINQSLAWKNGHKQARHDAAELALKADAVIEAARAVLEFRVDTPTRGDLRDNDNSRDALRALAEAVEALERPNVAIEGPEQAQLANGPSRMESSAS